MCLGVSTCWWRHVGVAHAVVVVAMFIAGGAVEAHGEFPYGVSPFVNDEGVLTGGATSYGLLSLEGDDLFWSSDEALSSTRLPDWVSRASDGRVLAGTFFGIYETRDLGCTWESQPGPIEGRYVNVMARSPTDRSRWYVATATGGEGNGVYVSVDDGRSWSKTGLEGSPYLLVSLKVGRDERIWVSGKALDSEATVLMRSRDGGQHWEDVVLPWGDDPTMVLAGLSESGEGAYLSRTEANGEVVLMRLSGDVSLEEGRFEGERVNDVVEFEGWRYLIVDGDVSYRDRGDGAWEKFVGGPTRCLAPDLEEGVLWGCAQLRERSNFMATEDGEVWRYEMRYTSVCPGECPDLTAGGIANREQWASMKAFGVGAETCEVRADEMIMEEVADAAPLTEPSVTGGCAVGGVKGSAPVWWLLLLGCFVWRRFTQ